MNNKENRPAFWDPWENAVSQSSTLLKTGLLEMEGTFNNALSTMERTISEKAERAVNNFEERIKTLEDAMQTINDKTRQDEEASRRMEEIIYKRLGDTIKNVEERLQKKMEKEMQSIVVSTQKNMMEALRVVEGGRKQLIKDEVRAMEERTVEKIEESVRSMEINMPEKVEQTIRENDERMKRMENMVRGRERRAHELLQKIEEHFVTSEKTLSNSTQHSSKATIGHKENDEELEDRMTKLEAFVKTSMSSLFTRVESLISQIERRPVQENIQQTSSPSSVLDHKSSSTAVDVEKTLRNAAREGDIANVRAALSAGAPIDCHCPNGLTALHGASREGHADVVKLLLDGGTDVNQTDNHGRTALHSAVETNRVKCAELLIAGGADLEKEDELGWTPLHVAANCAHAAAVRVLVDAGANRFKRNSSGETPLDVTYRIGVRFLLRQRSDERRAVPGGTYQSRQPAYQDGHWAAGRPRDRSAGRSPQTTPRSSQSPFRAFPPSGISQNPNVRGTSFSSSTESFQDEGYTYQDESNHNEYV